MAEKLIRYGVRHCRATLTSQEDGLWRLTGFRKSTRVVGSDRVPAWSGASDTITYDSPTMIFFDDHPSVAMREDASKWASIVKDQTSWTKYVFGEEFLFPEKKPIVLVSPSSGDEAYADHSNVLVPNSPPLVCLKDKEAVSQAARIAGASIMKVSNADSLDGLAERAREAAGLQVPSLAVGDGYAEIIPSTEISSPNLVVIIGPRHADATKVYQSSLEKIVEYALNPPIVEDDSGEVDETEDVEKFAKTSALSQGDRDLLGEHLIYVCRHGSLFELG